MHALPIDARKRVRDGRGDRLHRSACRFDDALLGQRLAKQPIRPAIAGVAIDVPPIH
jgi:hypothetical protein